MFGKLSDILLDIVKYASTASVLYSFLDGFPPGITYYVLVGVGIIALASLGLYFNHIQKKRDARDSENTTNNTNNNQNQ